MLLIKAGVASPESLKEKRPYVFIGCFVVGMLVTPPDMISQTLLAVPMWLLFEAGLFGARFLGSKKTEDADQTDSEKTDPTDSEPAALIDNEVSDQDTNSSDEFDEFDLYATVGANDNDSPINEELDKPEPLNDDGTDVDPPKPS
jgi:sec-independent protein translocase protein TatC